MARTATCVSGLVLPYDCPGGVLQIVPSLVISSEQCQRQFSDTIRKTGPVGQFPNTTPAACLTASAQCAGIPLRKWRITSVPYATSFVMTS